MALADQKPELARQALSYEEHGLEYLLMSLRLSEGLDIDRHTQISKSALESNIINDLSENGLLIRHNGRLVATAKGRVLLNAVIRKLAGA